jgi:hypothetical protein
MVYRVDVHGGGDRDWQRLHGRLFGSEDAAIAAVTDLLGLRLPKHTHSSMRSKGGLEIVPTVYRAPDAIWIVPVRVEGS